MNEYSTSSIEEKEIDKLLDFLDPKNLKFKEEPIVSGCFNEEGKSECILTEILVQGGNKDENEEIIKLLRKNDLTFKLFEKVLDYAFQRIKETGDSFSINAFLKDLGHKNLITLLTQKEAQYGVDKSMLTLEILECNHGNIDSETIENIKLLKNRGYKLAIDDLSLKESDDNISKKILKKMLEESIELDYVKIDGYFLKRVISDKYELAKYGETLKIMCQLLRSKKIKIIGEWIGNIEEGEKAQELGIQLYQGIYLNDSFRLDELDKGNTLQIPENLHPYIKELIGEFSNQAFNIQKK